MLSISWLYIARGAQYKFCQINGIFHSIFTHSPNNTLGKKTKTLESLKRHSLEFRRNLSNHDRRYHEARKQKPKFFASTQKKEIARENRQRLRPQCIHVATVATNFEIVD